MTDPLVPPRPARRPERLDCHGDTRIDPYSWLRDRSDPAVRAHLEAENAHFDAWMAPHQELVETIFGEIKARVLETDQSVPVRHRDWEYSTRTLEGAQYGIHCRRPAGRADADAVLLDENREAEGHAFFELGGFEVSPDDRLLAWSVDHDGGERFQLRVRDLATGTDGPTVIDDTYYGIAWSADSRVLFYTRPDDAMRPYQVWRHVLGTDPRDDVLVFEEPDEHFTVTVGLTKSEAFLVIHLESKTTCEARVLDATDPLGAFTVFAPREHGVEYGIEHDPGDPATGRAPRWLVLTNRGAYDFRLAETPVGRTGAEHWSDVVAHRPGIRLDDIEVFRQHLALLERRAGTTTIRVMSLRDGTDHVVEQPEEVCTVAFGPNPELDTNVLRFEYTSLVTPASVFDYDMDARRRELRKRQPVLGGYDPAAYETYRLWATAPDGESVPISVVAPRGVPRDGGNPCVLYGYGAYEISIDPAFSIARLSLLDRGFVFAIAHVRGGGELGRRWYDAGRLLAKPNTFTDFVAAAEALVAAGLTRPERLAIRGGSAGGLLVGAACNLRPDLFAAVVADVPFVDCLTTILDDSLPLTVGEWEEWGDPHDPVVYAAMRGYSPYDNVHDACYPAVYVTAGLNDPRVSYWEPAKWVAKLREHQRCDRPILLHTEMGAGHGGPSGRYDAWRDEASALAFVVTRLGAGGLRPPALRSTSRAPSPGS